MFEKLSLFFFLRSLILFHLSVGYVLCCFYIYNTRFGIILVFFSLIESFILVHTEFA